MWIVFGLAILITVQVHCTKPQKAAVEAIAKDQAKPLPFSFAALEGRRDGARVNATLEFEGSHKRDRLVLKLEVDLGPPIRLASGTFQIPLSDRTVTGKVEASSLDFQAGQSGGMSLGGHFVLLGDGGGTMYRVTLPPTLMGTAFH